jgi:flagellar biogenesis protein FliO
MEVSVISLFARLLVAMAVVLGLMFLAARVMRTRGSMVGARRGRPVPIEVLARQGLGRTASVALVRTSGKVLLLGVTEASVNMLAEVDPESIEDDGPGADWTALPGSGPVGSSGRTWRALIDAARERTVRRS